MKDAAGRPLTLVIGIGAGATGVELAVEPLHTTYSLVSDGPDRIAPERDIHIELIETGLRILGTSATRCRALRPRVCMLRLTAR